MALRSSVTVGTDRRCRAVDPSVSSLQFVVVTAATAHCVAAGDPAVAPAPHGVAESATSY